MPVTECGYPSFGKASVIMTILVTGTIDTDCPGLPHNIDDLLKAADAGRQTPHI